MKLPSDSGHQSTGDASHPNPPGTTANPVHEVDGERLPWFGRPWIRIATRVVLVLVATALSTVVFGLCIPMILLTLRVLPSLGVAGVIYFFIGGLFGLAFGAVSTAISLGRSPRLVSNFYLLFTGTQAVVALATLIAGTRGAFASV